MTISIPLAAGSIDPDLDHPDLARRGFDTFPGPQQRRRSEARGRRRSATRSRRIWRAANSVSDHGLPGRIESVIDPRDPRQGSFEINLNVENRHSFGDLASIGNLPAYRHYHVENFTTDEFGFRNRPERSANRTPDALVLGSSYIAQPGVVDDETLPALLAARSGLRIYNAATSGADPVVIGDFLGFVRRTVHRLGMNRGLVIFDYKAGE